MRTGMRLVLGFAGTLARCLVTMARRFTRIVRRLRRQAERGLKFAKTSAKLLVLRQQRRDQRVLVGARKRGKFRRRAHSSVESDSPFARHCKIMHRVNSTRYRLQTEGREQLQIFVRKTKT